MGQLRRKFGTYSGDCGLIRPLMISRVPRSAGRTVPSTRSVRAMSQSENVFDPARIVLDLPICPKCGARMWLSRIEPDEPGHDKRIFECPKCENVVSETFKYR